MSTVSEERALTPEVLPLALRARWWDLGGNRLAQIGLAGVVLSVLVMVAGPLVFPESLVQVDNTRTFLAPSSRHLLGTDQLGRDVLGLLVLGTRVSLFIALASVALSVTIGTLLGAVAGFLRGWVDSVIMRTVDVVLAVPRLVLLIAAVALVQTPGVWALVLILGLTQWPAAARLVRAEILSLKEQGFVEAAEALGYRRRRIVFRHLLPNALSPVLVVATLGIPHTVILESGLSFLGYGVSGSWGELLRTGQDRLITGEWWLALFPGLAVVIVALSFNLLGDGLRDVLDPRRGARR